jgi:K+ transporter
MTTWKTGRRIVAERLTARAIPIDHFMSVIVAAPPVRVPRYGRIHDGAARAAPRRRSRTTCATTRSCTSTSSS